MLAQEAPECYMWLGRDGAMPAGGDARTRVVASLRDLIEWDARVQCAVKR